MTGVHDFEPTPVAALDHSTAYARETATKVERAFSLTVAAGAEVYLTGGLARGDLCPFADVDVLVLIDDASSTAGTTRAEQAVAELWDAGMTLSARVAPLDDLSTMAEAEHELFTLLLEAIPIAGSANSLARLRRALLAKAGSGLADDKRAELSARAARTAARTGACLEPDLKSDAGSIRDVHTALWLDIISGQVEPPAQLGEGIREMFAREIFDDGETIARAYDMLIATRTALHQVTGSPGDRLLRDAQVAVATALGYTGPEHAQAEALLRDVALAQRAIAFAVSVHADLEDTRADRQYARAVRQRLTRAEDRARERDDIVREMLHGEASVQRPFLALCRGDVLGSLFADLERLRGIIRLDGYHAYATDEHIARCADAALAVCLGNAQMPASLTAVLQEPVDTVTLVAAALFHDIGKGLNEDHSVAGVKIAERELFRLGAAPSLRATVTWLVENHLALSNTAQRRDLGDPAIVAALAETVGTRARLRLLTLLTIVDVQSVAPRMLNEWKARLFKTAYDSVLRHWADAAPSSGMIEDAIDEKTVRQGARAILDGHLSAPLLDAFVEGASIRGLSTRFDAALVGDAMTFVHYHAAGTVVFDTRTTPGGDATIIRIAGPGLRFALICDVLARERVRILHAHVDHRNDGLSLVALRVDDASSVALTSETLLLIEEQLLRAVAPGADKRTQPRFLWDGAPVDIPYWVRAEVNVDSWGGVVVDVGGADRPGVLAAMTAAIDEAGYQTVWLKAATTGARLRDSFVLNGPLDDASVDALSARLRAVLRPREDEANAGTGPAHPGEGDDAT